MANPYVQIDSILSQPHKSKNKSSIQSKDHKMRNSITGLPTINSKPTGDDLQLHFDKWFLFCQRCRHGGHTQCMNAWFSSQDGDADEVCESLSNINT